MTISSKLVDINGLEFAVSKDTDTIDVGGFSDVLSVVGAKTAKFSGGSTMQSNVGLRIGTTQLKINGVPHAFISGTVIDSDPLTPSPITNPANVEDADDSTFTGPDDQNLVGDNCITIDFGVVQNSKFRIKSRVGTTIDCSYKVQRSTDNIDWDDTGITLVNTIGEIVDVTSGSVFNFRYLRVVVESVQFASTFGYEFFVLGLIESDTFTANINIRSSTTIDTANGTILKNIPAFIPGITTIFDTDLLLVINGGFLTLEIVSFSILPFSITLSEITSIKEV